MTEKIVHLEVNDAGGWRRVMSFDAGNEAVGSQCQSATENLLRLSSSAHIKARIIIPGDTAPLLTWTAARGWMPWRHPGEQAA